MRQVGTISVLHIIFLSMTFIGLKNHVTILPPILKVAGRDGWASVLIAMLVILPWIWLLVYIHKSSASKRLADWLRQSMGQIPSTIVIYGTSIYLLILAAFTMRETLQWVTTAFLPKTPMLLLLLMYIVLCILLVSTTIQTIAMINVIVLFGVVIFGFFVAITNIQVKDYSLLMPFFEEGLQSSLLAAVYPASGFVELLLLLFLQHHIHGRIRWYHFVIMLVILTGLTWGPLVGAITEFGPDEAAKQRYPAYEEWGLVQIGRFIEHLDFFSIYQWMTGAFIRIGLILFIVVDLLNIQRNPKKIWKIVAPAFFFLNLILFVVSDPVFLKLKGDYLLTITFGVFFVLSLLLGFVAYLSNRSKKKRKKSSNRKDESDAIV